MKQEVINFSVYFAGALFRKSVRDFVDEKSKMEISSTADFLYRRVCAHSRSLPKFTGGGWNAAAELHADC